MILGVDVGGTFTDVVLWDEGTIRTAKVPTTAEESEGVVAGGRRVVSGRVGTLLHGTTVATNALLERTGARTALVTDEGFTDVIEIGRQDRPRLYDPFADRPEPLVARRDRHGWAGDRQGAIPLAPDVEAVAVSLLYAYADPSAERAVREVIRRSRSGLPVSLSSEVAPEFREYERASTTVLNAYLTPATASALAHLAGRVRAAGLAERLAVMRSSGGLMSVEEAMALPAAVLLSGPAGGVVAAAALGALLGREHLVSFDMGGTSTDVCRIEGGRPEISYERPVAGYPCRMPATAVHTVGAGGGSIGWVDAGGSLRVGPRSAGARPGPACYRRGGTLPTVTDANVLLGRIGADAALGGELVVDAPAATSALSRLAGESGLDVVQTALGMVEVVEEVMAGAVRTVSIEQGADPRDAVLVAFGGAGGLHAGALARRLEMGAVVVPPHAGVFSALGLLLSPPRVDTARSVLLDRSSAVRLDEAVAAIAAAARDGLETAGERPEAVVCMVDVRYRGQSHEVTVPYRQGEGWTVLTDRFHRAHEARNGFARPEDPIEVVTVRAEAVGVPALRVAELPRWRPDGSEAFRGRRPLRTRQGIVDAGRWWRPALRPDAEIVGPAIVEEPEATTYLAAGDRAVVHPTGALEVTW